MTSQPVVELVSAEKPLPVAIEQAFERLRLASSSHSALIFDLGWRPTMDVVDLIVEALSTPVNIETLTLIHPSAAMSVIAAAIASRAQSITVTSRRSLYDEPEDEEMDATESNTFFRMQPDEPLDSFIRRSMAEARKRAVRRFALVFDGDSRPNVAVADTLVEELVQSGVREMGLIHPTANLDAIAGSVRLRLPNVRIALGSERKT